MSPYYRICLLLKSRTPIITEHASYWEVWLLCLLLRSMSLIVPPIEKYDSSFWEVCLLVCLLVRSMPPIMPPSEKYASYSYRLCLQLRSLLQSIPPVEKHASYWEVCPPPPPLHRMLQHAWLLYSTPTYGSSHHCISMRCNVDPDYTSYQSAARSGGWKSER